MELGKNDKKGCVTMLRIKDDFKTMEYYQKELENLEKRIKRFRDNINQENASRLQHRICYNLEDEKGMK